MEEERYRLPQRRERRTLAEEISKFSLCFALSEYDRAAGRGGGRRIASAMDVASIKAGILAETVRAGDEVEGEAMASPFAAIYHPRAYYPSYLLGEMRAALRRGERPPSASPHYLPVSALPPLPDGSGVAFLYQVDKSAFDRHDFPAQVRDVFTRDYPRFPLLVPPHQETVQGRVRFRARLLRIDRDSAHRLAGLRDDPYDTYSARGLTFFLQPLELEDVDDGPGLRGSLYAELSFAQEPAWEGSEEKLEGVVRDVAEEVFPPCERGGREEPGCYLPHSGFHVTRFRRRFFALVYDPVIAVYRAPRLLGLYLPVELMRGLEGSSALFERFVRAMSSSLRDALGLDSPPRVEMAYDNRQSWAREGGALRGPSFDSLVDGHPFLGPTLAWLRGD